MIIDTIRKDFLDARKARDLVKANLLSTVVGEITKIEKAPNAKPLTDEDVIKVVRKFVESAKEVKAAIPDQTAPAVAVANVEIGILESYLPQMMDDAAIEAAIRKAVEGGANNIGAVMGYMKSNHGGMYDGKSASAIAKTVLAG